VLAAGDTSRLGTHRDQATCQGTPAGTQQPNQTIPSSVLTGGLRIAEEFRSIGRVRGRQEGVATSDRAERWLMSFRPSVVLCFFLRHGSHGLTGPELCRAQDAQRGQDGCGNERGPIARGQGLGVWVPAARLVTLA
jgi:hypothetical protein